MNYTYKCEKCELERIESHGVNETPMFYCECGSKKPMFRKIGVIDFIAKCSGFVGKSK